MNSDEKIKKKYSDLAEDYDKRRFNSFGGRLIDSKQKKVLLKFLKDTPKTAKILEVGCGSGRFLEFLGKEGYKNIYGIDTSKEMLSIAEKKSNAVLKIGNVYKIPYKKNEFDVVFSVHVLMHIQNPKKMISEMLRVSKKSVIVDITNKNSLSFVLSKIVRGYKPKFYSLKIIREIAKGYDMRFKPTYMFPMKGNLPFFYYPIALLLGRIAFILQLGRFASQLFIEIKKTS